MVVKGKIAMRNYKSLMIRQLSFLCALGLFISVGCGGIDDPSENLELSSQSMPLKKMTGFTEGGKCTVTEGDSKGKKGTYDEDGWCCVDGGMTCVECDKPGGGSRCKDGHKITAILSTPVVSTATRIR